MQLHHSNDADYGGVGVAAGSGTTCSALSPAHVGEHSRAEGGAADEEDEGEHEDEYEEEDGGSDVDHGAGSGAAAEPVLWDSDPDLDGGGTDYLSSSSGGEGEGGGENDEDEDEEGDDNSSLAEGSGGAMVIRDGSGGSGGGELYCGNENGVGVGVGVVSRRSDLGLIVGAIDDLIKRVDEGVCGVLEAQQIVTSLFFQILSFNTPALPTLSRSLLSKSGQVSGQELYSQLESIALYIADNACLPTSNVLDQPNIVRQDLVRRLLPVIVGTACSRLAHFYNMVPGLIEKVLSHLSTVLCKGIEGEIFPWAVCHYAVALSLNWCSESRSSEPAAMRRGFGGIGGVEPFGETFSENEGILSRKSLSTLSSMLSVLLQHEQKTDMCAHTKQVHQFIEDILHFSIFNKSTSSSWIYIAASLATTLPVSTLSTLLSHLWSRLPHCGSQIVAAFLDFPVEATQCTILVTDQTTAGTYSSDNKYSGLWRGALVFLIAAAHTTTLRKQIFKALGILFSSTGFLQSGDIQSVVKLLLLPNVMDVWLELGCYLCSIRDIPPSLTSVEILCESQTLQPLREFGCLLLKQVFCVSPESRPLVLLTLLQRLSHCTIMNSKRKQPSLDTQSNTFLQVLHEIAGAMICCECADSQALFSLTLQHTIDIGPKGAYQIMCAFEELLLHLPSLIVQTLNFTKTLTKGDCDLGLSSGHKGGTHVIGMCLLAGLLPCLLRGPHEMELDQIEHYVTIVCDSLTQAVLHPSYSHIERRTLYDVISVLFEKCGEKLYLASPHYLSPLVIAEPLTQKLCSCIQWVNPPRKEAPVFEEIVTLSTTRDSEMGSELAELYLPYVIDHEEPVDSLLHCAVSFLSTYGECTALAPGVCALKVILHWVCVQFAAEKLEPKALGFTPRKMSEAGTFIPNIRSAYNLMLPCCMTLCAYDSTFHKGGLQETLLLCCEWLHKMCWSVKFYSCVSREIIERMVPPMVSVLKRCAVLLLGPREDEHREILCELSNISPLKALNFAVNVIYTQILNTRTHNLKPHLVDHNDTGITCFILSHTLSKITDAGSSETTLSPSERKQLLGIQTTCLKVVCMLPQALFSPEVLKLISHPASDSSAHSDNIFVLLTWANSFSQQLRAFKIHPPHRSTVECELQSFSVKVNLIWILTRKSLLQHHHHLSDNILSPASTSIVLSIASVMKEKLCQMRVPHVPPPPQTLEVMLQLILYSDLDSAPRFLSGVLQQSFSLSPRYSQMPLVQTKFVSKYTRQYKKFLQSRSRIVSAILSFFMHHLFCTCKLSYISIGNLLPQQIETKKFVARLHKPLFDSAIDYLFQLFKAACTSQLTVSAAALVFRVVCILVLLCIRIHNNLRETNSSTSPESEICWPVSLVLRLSKDITQWVEKGGADSVRPQTKRMVNAITPRCAKLQFMCNQLPPRRNEEGKEEESSAEEEEESESASAEEYAEEMLESDSETPESPGSAGGAIPSSSDSDTVSKTSPKRKSTRKTSASARKQQPQAPASHSNKSKHTKKARTNTSPPKPVTSTSTSTSASTTPTANSRKKRRKKRAHTAARSRNTVIDYLLSLDCNSDQELDPNDAFEDLEDWLVLTE